MERVTCRLCIGLVICCCALYWSDPVVSVCHTVRLVSYLMFLHHFTMTNGENVQTVQSLYLVNEVYVSHILNHIGLRVWTGY